MGVLRASWNRFRLPVALAAIEPERQGHQQLLFRQMRKDFAPPAGGREVVVVADAGSPANATLHRLKAREWPSGLALPRPRKCAQGQDVRAVVHPLPQAPYRRRAPSTPDGRRQDDGVCMRHAALPQRGAVTIVRSKKRRNVGPKRGTIIVPTLQRASASAILSHYAVRWAVERTIKDLQGGRHVGRLQVSQDAERVERSVMLPVWAYLLGVHLYGTEEQTRKDWSLLQLTQRCTEAFRPDQGPRVAQKWRRKWRKIKQAA